MGGVDKPESPKRHGYMNKKVQKKLWKYIQPTATMVTTKRRSVRAGWGYMEEYISLHSKLP